MATLQRVEPHYTAWTPSAAGLATERDEEYLGRHRRGARRVLSLTRMFYAGKHRRH